MSERMVSPTGLWRTDEFAPAPSDWSSPADYRHNQRVHNWWNYIPDGAKDVGFDYFYSAEFNLMPYYPHFVGLTDTDRRISRSEDRPNSLGGRYSAAISRARTATAVYLDHHVRLEQVGRWIHLVLRNLIRRPRTDRSLVASIRPLDKPRRQLRRLGQSETSQGTHQNSEQYLSETTESEKRGGERLTMIYVVAYTLSPKRDATALIEALKSYGTGSITWTRCG